MSKPPESKYFENKTVARSVGQLKENIWNKKIFHYVYILTYFGLMQNLQ